MKSVLTNGNQITEAELVEPQLCGQAKRETDIRDEADYLNRNWGNGYYHFLLSRTDNEFHRAGVRKRRNKIESRFDFKCPLIRDEILEELFFKANERNYRSISSRFKYSNPFTTTPSERTFLRNLKMVIDSDDRYQGLKVIPSEGKENKKWSVGLHVPDVMILGLKQKGFSGAIFEIMGGIHDEKAAKDDAFNNHMEQLGLMVYPILNHRVGDIEFIRKIVEELVLASNIEKLRVQTIRLKRRIWAKTIATYLSLDEIEKHIQQRYGTDINLKKELIRLLCRKDCPRKIRREAFANNGWVPPCK